MNEAQATLLAGTEGAADPFFSPAGDWIGFFAGGKMKKVAVRGSAVIVLCDARQARGASWGEDGNIIATLDSDTGVGLSRISDKGGDPKFITNPREKGEATHRWPQILPGGEEVLFTANKKAATYDESNIDVLSLKTGQVKEVLSGGYYARYMAGSAGSGYLIYIRQGTLFGVSFDLEHLETRGTPTPLLDDVASDSNTAGGQFDFSGNGTFVYLSGKGATGSWNLVWLDNNGKTEPFSAAAGLYYQPRFSPDGKRLAFSNGTDINVYDWARGTLDRLNFRGPATNFFPVWTPDGKHLAFQSQGPGSWSLQWMRADGAGEAEPLYTSKNRVAPYSFSSDGKRVAFSEQKADTGWDLFTLQLDTTDPEHLKPGQPEPFLHTASDEQSPALSPDGHWLAYESNESGRSEIYMRPFPAGSGKTTISTGGGSRAKWSSNGRELFYLSADKRIMTAAFDAKGEAEKPRPSVSTQLDPAANAYGWDRTPDGKRFVVTQLSPSELEGEAKGSVHVTFLVNFLDEVRRRIPGK